MTIELFAHPFSSYCQKAITAFYENDIAFELRMLEPGYPALDEFAAIWPIGRFPLLREDGRVVPEATMIIEYLHVHHPGPVRLIPEDADAALAVRTLDRFFDKYVELPLQKVVVDRFRPEGRGDLQGVEEAKAVLARSWAILEDELADGREWAAGDEFTLADCGAAPALFYADMVQPFAGHSRVEAYYGRLRARPSFVRAVDEARPYRSLFPLEWPERHD